MVSGARKGTTLLACVAVAAAGCGGGQQSAGPPGGAVQTSKAGQAVLTYFGQPQPLLTASSGEVSVLGQAGATFTAMTLEPPPNIEDTFLVYSRNVNGRDEIYELPFATNSPQILVHNAATGGDFVGISHYGTVAFDEQFSAYTVRPDGTGLAPLTMTGFGEVLGPEYSQDGTNRIAFYDDAGHLCVGPGTGGTASIIQSNDANAIAAWSPTSSTIAYEIASGSGGEMVTTAATGGTTTDVTPTFLQGAGYFYDPVWNADGFAMAVTYLPNGASVSQIVVFEMNDPSEYLSITPSGDNDGPVCFSPDGTRMMFYRGSQNGATPGLYLTDPGGVNPVLYVSDPPNAPSGTGFINSLAWSTFLPNETVVATTGSTFYHSACSGFLMSELYNRFGSLLAFTANTPSTATIPAPSATSGSQPLLFTLSGDSITKVGYMNSYFSPGTTISLTSTPTIAVAVDASTGQVDLVAPAAKIASTAKSPTGNVIYSGMFKALYDKSGNNLAPSGASQLVINPKTGGLVSFK